MGDYLSLLFSAFWQYSSYFPTIVQLALAFLQGRVCVKCGDKGFHEGLLTCSQCKIISEHRYCIVSYPTISEPWLCETCEENKQKMQLPSRSLPFNKTKENAKVKFISAEEVASLALGSKTPLSSTRGCLGVSVPRTGDIPKKPYLASKSVSPRSISTTELQGYSERRTSHISIPPGFQSLRVDDEASHMPSKSCSKSSLTIKSEDALASLQPVSIKYQLTGLDSRCDLHVSPLHTNNEHVMPPDKALASCKEEVIEGCSYLEVCASPLKPARAGEQKSSTEVSLSCDDGKNSGFCADIQCLETDFQGSGLSSTLLTVPIANEIQWRGRFVIKDVGDHIYEDIRAHFSGKISTKAYNASKALPEKLQFRLINRLDIWPKVFQLDPPCCDDVAMYFLPSEFDRPKEKYIRLVQRMSKHDLAMHCNLDGLELLIYTSKLLVLDPQKLNTGLYLWGIFRHSRRKKLNQETGVPGDGNYVKPDLVVDMVAGKDVGKIDKPAAKPPLIQRGQSDECRSASDQNGLNINESSTALLKLGDNPEELNIPIVPPGFSKLRKEGSWCEKKPLVKFALKKPVSHIISDIRLPFSGLPNLKHGSGSSESARKSPIPQKYDKGHPTCATRGERVISGSNKDKVNSGCHQAPLIHNSSDRKVTGQGEVSRQGGPVKNHSLVSAGYGSPTSPLRTGSTLSLFSDSEGRVDNVGEPHNGGKDLGHRSSRPVRPISADLTLSRPQYINDGKRWIPAASRDRLSKDDCGKDVRLTL